MNTRQQTERVAKKGLRNSLGNLPTSKQPPPGTLRQILQVSFLFFYFILLIILIIYLIKKRNVFDVCQVIRTEGWGGLYSGLKPSLFGTAASQVSPFCFFLKKNNFKNQLFNNFFFLKNCILNV